MTRLSIVVALFAAVAVIGCVKDSTTDQKDTADKRPARASELADSPPAQAPDVCALLSAKEIEEIVGVPLERAEKNRTDATGTRTRPRSSKKAPTPPAAPSRGS